MAKIARLLAATALAFGTFPTHLAIATSEAPILENIDSENTNFAPDNSSGENSDLDAPPDETLDIGLESLYIKAVNPGYNGNAGEFVEIINPTAEPLPLFGVSLVYNNGTKDYLVYDFPEHSFLLPGSLVLRLQSSPEVKNAAELSEVANLTYTKDLAMSGSLRLVFNKTSEEVLLEEPIGELLTEEEVLSSACWAGKNECARAFKSSTPTTLVFDEASLEYVHLESYEPNFNPENYQVIEPEVIEPEYEDTEPGDSTSPTDEPVENPVENSEATSVAKTCAEGYYLNETTNRCNKVKEEAEPKVCAEGYFLNEATNRCNKIKEEAAPKTCEEGYYLNEATNRCNKIKEETAPKTCEDGYYLNTATNRCNKLPEEKTLAPCKDGYERNPETNRCRKITADAEDEDELKPCAEGYERNPETNRCRKIKINDGADYALVPTAGGVEQKNFTALWAMLGLGVAVVGVVIFQFRHELGHFLKKLKSRLK